MEKKYPTAKNTACNHGINFFVMTLAYSKMLFICEHNSEFVHYRNPQVIVCKNINFVKEHIFTEFVTQ